MTKQVSFIQINNSFSGQTTFHILPLLHSYFVHNSSASDEYSFTPFIYKRAPVLDIVNSISSSEVLGLSLYAWNTRLSLEIARQFRALNPNALIFVGGPSVPDSAEVFLRSHPYVDIALHNEGELSVTALLEENLRDRNFLNVPSASFLSNNLFVSTPRAPRIDDLSSIPSPFLTGSFDQLFKQNPDERWIGLWETNRGCPFTCTYCDWGSATGSKRLVCFPTVD